MRKILTLIQLIIGVVVILFAFIILWQAVIDIDPSVKEFLSIDLPFRINGLNKWIQLLMSLFIIQVVAVYTKKLFDRLSISD